MDGQDIAQFLLREGWAELPIDVTDQAYVEASELAYSRGLGIWGDGPPLAKPAPVRHSARWAAVPRQGLPCIKCVRGAGPPPMTQIKIEANELACRNKEWGWHDDPRLTFACGPIATRDLQTSANSSQMTVLVSVKINDGVVMAADSASSFESGMVYQNADKIVNLMEGLPIGAMATGAGGIGNESIDTLMKDLRRRFSGADARHPDWALDPATYTLRDVAIRLRSFLFEEKVKAYSGSVWTRLRICGYSAGRPLAEVWEVLLMGSDSPAPTQVQGEQEFGIRWDGEYEALSRLIFGLGTRFEEAAAKSGLSREQVADLRGKLAPELFELLFVEAMPIQDAVDLARFLVEATISFVKFSVARPKTVGGPIGIAAITKHEGFRWFQRPRELAWEI
jgi:hypothetical protein